MSASPPPPSRPDVPSGPASVPELASIPTPLSVPELVEGSFPVEEHLLDLIARATSHDGSPPFSDGSLVELRAGERRAVWLDDVAVALVTDNEAEFVVDPTARRQGHGRELLHRLLVDAPADLLIWAHGAHPAALALAAHFGLQPVRQLLQLRLNLAEVASCVDVEAQTSTQLATSRKITRGMTGHEDAWLELNTRAFAAHPEQGRVTRADLDALMREDWFEDDDVLLLWDGDALIGYCWMKIERGSGHAEQVSTRSTSESADSNGSTSGSEVSTSSTNETVGEFYVVGVDPARQREGIGRVLVSAGLEHLKSRGIPIAHLYVEGDNTAAVRLYRSFGFRDYALDIQYRWRSEPDEPLDGGNLTPVVRRGNDVHREAGPWTPTIHRLLNHLRSNGVDWVPEPRGFDQQGREILEFVEGVVPAYPMPEWVWDESVLVDAGRRLRELHDASVSFPRADATWRMPPHGDEVICHNDFVPYNFVFRDGGLAGAIDFDTASPGTRLWDIAYLAYRAVPLNDRDLELSIPNRRARLQMLLDAYGSDATIDELAQMAVARLTDLAEFTEQRAKKTGRTDLLEHVDLYRHDAASLPTLL